MRPQESTSVSWQSVTWPDGSKVYKHRYEGLVKEELSHLRGVSMFADGDRYEGEFLDNCMEGFGVYHWHDGMSFKGAWHQDKMHGCGIKFIPDDSEIMQQAGQFIDDEYIGPSDVCSVAAAQRAAQQALTAARLASGLQEKEGAEGLQLRHHESHQGLKAPSHATAFKSLSKSRTQSRTLQGATSRKKR